LIQLLLWIYLITYSTREALILIGYIVLISIFRSRLVSICIAINLSSAKLSSVLIIHLGIECVDFIMIFHLLLIHANLYSLKTWYVFAKIALVLRILLTAYGLKLVMLWWFGIVDTKLAEFLIQFIFFIVRFVLKWVNLIEIHLISHVLLCKLLLFLYVVLDPSERVSVWGRLLMIIDSPTSSCGHDLILLLKLILIYHPW
jgi:hypothetical protein